MPASLTGKLADPAFRTERARRAAATRTSLDHHIQKVVDAAPTLTAEQIERLRALLPVALEANHG
jgi:hypothetical protein